jgi:hypothetical protein
MAKRTVSVKQLRNELAAMQQQQRQAEQNLMMITGSLQTIQQLIDIAEGRRGPADQGLSTPELPDLEEENGEADDPDPVSGEGTPSG